MTTTSKVGLGSPIRILLLYLSRVCPVWRLAGLHSPVANILRCMCAKNYENWPRVQKVTATKKLAH